MKCQNKRSDPISRAFRFTTGSTPMDAAACVASVKLLESSDERVQQLWENTRYFKSKITIPWVLIPAIPKRR